MEWEKNLKTSERNARNDWNLYNLKIEFSIFSGETPFAPFTLAKNVTKDKLKILLDAFKNSADDDEDEETRDQPYLFFINGHEITSDIQDCVKHQIVNAEKTVNIVYQPQAVFRYVLT